MKSDDIHTKLIEVRAARNALKAELAKTKRMLEQQFAKNKRLRKKIGEWVADLDAIETTHEWCPTDGCMSGCPICIMSGFAKGEEDPEEGC